MIKDLIESGKIKAAIFDLDGTLIDSMAFWDKLFLGYIKNLDFGVGDGILSKVAFMTMDEIAETISRMCPNINKDGKSIKAEWINAAYDAYKNKIPLKVGAYEFVKKLKANNIKIAVSTSCPRPLATASLEKNNILHMCDELVFSDEIGVNKESPDVYLKALEKLGASVDEAVLFEDLKVALNTAKSIKLKTVIIEDVASLCDREYFVENADMYIKDYTELL